jgi:hypothetical protein
MEISVLVDVMILLGTWDWGCASAIPQTLFVASHAVFHSQGHQHSYPQELHQTTGSAGDKVRPD